jgi:DNA-binding phage protein
MNATAALSHYEEDDSQHGDASRMEAFAIGVQMRASGLPDRFIVQAIDLSEEFKGILGLLRMWRDESDPSEREATIADIQELIEDCSQQGKVEAAYIRFDDLECIAADVRKFKDNLRVLVDARGGIGKLSEVTHIPQPSLSRFFNSAAMPRRTTLNKIARALNLSQVQIATGWSV